MKEYETFVYYGGIIVTILVGLALLSTFFTDIPDLETLRIILSVAFIIGVCLNLWVSSLFKKKEGDGDE